VYTVATAGILNLRLSVPATYHKPKLKQTTNSNPDPIPNWNIWSILLTGR